MRFGLSLPTQGIQEMGFRVHWPGMPHQRVLEAIALLGERVLPLFA